MNKEKLENYKNKLEEEMNLLVSELSNIGRITNEQTGDWEAIPEEKDQSTADENTNADRNESFEERSSTLDTLEKRLGEVKGAISKIENGTYGVCENCGGEIEEDRLTANPSSKTCKAHMNMN